MLGIIAIILGLLFKGQNVAFMVGLAFAIAASANFPSLLLSIVWRDFSTRGAVWSIITGSTLSVVLIPFGNFNHIKSYSMGGFISSQYGDLSFEKSCSNITAGLFSCRLSGIQTKP